MGDRSKLHRSLVRLRRRLQRREKGKKGRKNQSPEGQKQTLLSIEVAELLLPHGQTSPPPTLLCRSFLCGHLTRLLKEQQQLFNLQRYCPTEGFAVAGKRPSSIPRGARASEYVRFNTPIQIRDAA